MNQYDLTPHPQQRRMATGARIVLLALLLIVAAVILTHL
jgi:hypothetical protein